MTVSWSEIDLGDFIELKRGYDLPKSKRLDGDVEIISSSGSSGYHNESKVKAPGVITGRYGTIGKVFYSEEDFWPLNTTLYVKDFKGNDPLFVYYLMKTLNYLEYSDKAAVPGINRNHIHKAKIKVPSCPKHQNELALKLWHLDKKITNSHQINQTLEQISQTIFKSWFVNFEPVKAKIAAREALLVDNRLATQEQISQAEQQAAIKSIEGVGDVVLTEQLHSIANLFPCQLVESELGNIPFGWKGKSFDAVFKERKEKVKKRSDVRVLSAVQTGELKVPEDVFKKQVHSKDISKYKLVYPTDLAYNPSRINIGSAGFNIFGYMGAVSPVYSVMKLKEEDLLAFATMQMKRQFVKSWIESLCSGSVRQSLSVEDLLYIPIVIPSSDILNKFNQIFEIIESKISANKDENRTLEYIRDTLLTKLLSGEIHLTNNQKEVVNG
jgi:type I restriction enzyme S subunit